MSESRRTILPSRFYKNADVSREVSGFAVRLDGKPLRTPGRRPLVVPQEAVANAIAAEWAAQGERIDPASMPVTRLANTILDGIADDPSAVREDLKRYIESDLLFYRAGAPERFVERQVRSWDPVLRWAEAAIGGLFLTVTGVMHVEQPSQTVAAFRAHLDREEDPFVLAALHQMTTLTGSAILAFAVLKRHFDVEEAWGLAHVDEDWNIEHWGEDEEAAARRAGRFEEMRAAALVIGR